MSESPTHRWFVTRWALWSIPGRVVAAVLLVESAALYVVVASALTDGISGRAVLFPALLTLLGVVHTEVATGVERIRRRVAGTSYFDLSSVWTFAAAVLLPPALAATVIMIVYLHLWLRVWKPARIPLYRNVFSVASVMLAAAAAYEVIDRTGGVHGWPDGLAGLGAITLAILVYVTVNSALVAGVIALSTSRLKIGELLGQWDDNMLEIATLSLGALAAVALSANPWLVVLVLPPLLVLHRAVLVRQLEEVANTDGKTGLLNAAAWHSRAAREMRRAHRAKGAAAVLILDLDHFKAVNDAHGHLAGDEVLVAVARTLRTEVREHDLVGRFGGEEFVVLLPDLPPEHTGQTELYTIAERIRHRVSELSVVVDTPDGPLTIGGLSISVGGATYPTDGASLEQVMQVADAALYAAKRAGRNVVRIAPTPPGPRARDASH